MKRAFTLIELVVTVCIIMILVMILGVSFNRTLRTRRAIMVPITKQQ